MSEQTDTIEAVARGWAESIAQHLCHPADQDAAIRLVTDALARFERDRIAAHMKALVDGAGELERRLLDHAHMIQRDGLGAMLDTATQAAATIAALRAEIERAKEEGVRAGIEAALAAINDETPLTSSDTWGEGWADCRNAVKTLDAAAIAKGV